MKGNLDYLGKWPIDGKEARKEQRLIPITPQGHLHLIHGKKHHVGVSFIVSNDYMHVGIITIPVNGYSEMESHVGEESLWVLQGALVVRTLGSEEEDNKENASHISHKIEQDEKFFMPEGIKHQYINFTDDVVKVFFVVAAQL